MKTMMSHRRGSARAMAVMALVAAACSGEADPSASAQADSNVRRKDASAESSGALSGSRASDSSPGVPDGEGSRKEWTLAIYLGSETLSDQAAIANLNALEQRYAELSGFMDIIVLADGYFESLEAGWDDRTRILKIRSDDSVRIVSEIAPPPETKIAKLLEAGHGELALSTPEVLQAFLAFTQAHYPARHFALNVVDHGDGWRGAVFDYDEEMRMFGPLRNKQYHDVFATLAQPIDVLGFDACIMQEASANTWWQLGGSKVKFSVASEQVQGVLGWNMDGVARRLAERRRGDGQLSPRAFATEVVNGFYDVPEGWNDTLSALDLSLWPQVLEQLDALGAAMSAAGGMANPIIKSVVDERVPRNYGAMVGLNAAYSEEDLVDGIELCLALEQAFEATTAVNQMARALRDAIEKAVVVNVSNSSTSHGVTLHLPRTGIGVEGSQSEFEKHAAEVLDLTPNWRAFLRSI
ncbi:MAG TPA: clostripain-related cysteine peptidase [Polyangiaceae bacterium]|nr:clostripain-related cysteine peptidase [Polyangiaceae bacterium]